MDRAHVRVSHGFNYNAGGLFESYNAAGQPTWMVDKQGPPYESYGATDGVSVNDVACDAAGRCALFGGFGGPYRQAWIEIFALP